MELYRYSGPEPAHLIELLLPETLDAAEFDRLNESALLLLRDKQSQPWVIDLNGVDYMGSAMLGLIINIRQQIKAGGGRLALCRLSPSLIEIFRTCSLERLFTIAHDRDEAIRIVCE